MTRPASKADQPSSCVQETASGLRAWNIEVGNFFFRHRNAVFPVVFLLVVLTMRPRIIGTPSLDRLLILAGVLVAVAGEALRLVTIGFDYIDRGGKNRKVYASRLVQGGVYGLTRNPMYLANGMIAVGMTMLTGSPLTYVLVIPFFLFVYQAIISAEEAFLHKQFGRDYEEYCTRANRILPSFRGIREAFAGMRYNWKRSLKQDLSTIAGVLMGLILIPFCRTFFLGGWPAARAEAPSVLALSSLVGLLYGLLVFLKKRQRLFY